MEWKRKKSNNRGIGYEERVLFNNHRHFIAARITVDYKDY